MASFTRRHPAALHPQRPELPRRAFLHVMICAAALPVVPRLAEAQAYPSRPVKLVVPFPPGGAFDAVGRPWANMIAPIFGVVVIENMGGAGGSMGGAAVARARPDGYTILLGGTQTLLNEALLKSRPLYDPLKDLDPIASLAANPLCITVHPGVPAQTLRELIAYAKANPGKLSYGHSGVGSLQHLAGELFKSLAATPDIVPLSSTFPFPCRCRIEVLVPSSRTFSADSSYGNAGDQRAAHRTAPGGKLAHPCRNEPRSSRRRAGASDRRRTRLSRHDREGLHRAARTVRDSDRHHRKDRGSDARDRRRPGLPADLD